MKYTHSDTKMIERLKRSELSFAQTSNHLSAPQVQSHAPVVIKQDPYSADLSELKDKIEELMKDLSSARLREREAVLDLQRLRGEISELNLSALNDKAEISGRDRTIQSLNKVIEEKKLEIIGLKNKYQEKENDTSNSHTRAMNEIKQKDDIIERLESVIRQKNLEISAVKERFSNTSLGWNDEMTKKARPAPQIERVPQIEVQMNYTQDPYILEQNKKLQEDLRITLVKES